MRHVKRYRRLSRNSAHRRAMLRNLATSFFIHGRIRTTLVRAKELQPIVEKLISAAIQGKNGNLSKYRKFKNYLFTTSTTRLKVLDYVRDAKSPEPGGWTRIQKHIRRPGDGAWMAEIVFLQERIPETPPPVQAQTKTGTKKHPMAGLIAADSRTDGFDALAAPAGTTDTFANIHTFANKDTETPETQQDKLIDEALAAVRSDMAQQTATTTDSTPAKTDGDAAPDSQPSAAQDVDADKTTTEETDKDKAPAVTGKKADKTDISTEAATTQTPDTDSAPPPPAAGPDTPTAQPQEEQEKDQTSTATPKFKKKKSWFSWLSKKSNKTGDK